MFGDGFELNGCRKAELYSVVLRLGSDSEEGEMLLTGRDRILAIGEALVLLARQHAPSAAPRAVE